MLHGAGSSFLKMGLTFAAWRTLGNIPILKEMLANNEIVLLGSILNNFELFGMLAQPNALLAFSELIIEVTSSSSVGLNVDPIQDGLFRGAHR